jgi:ABC-type multidrug transport system ATPase subunit
VFVECSSVVEKRRLDFDFALLDRSSAEKSIRSRAFSWLERSRRPTGFVAAQSEARRPVRRGLGMADVRYASRDDVGPSSDAPTRGVELTDASERTDVPMPSWPMLGALRKVALVVWKNLQLRGNRPTATILEVVFPLIAFVALAVMTPRNEYFDAPYFPGVPWMPPACVLQFGIPVPSALLAEGVSAETAKALAPEVCPGAGHLAGPHVTVLFAPDTEATRALMRAACELRYAPPGIERVAYGFTTLAGAAGAETSQADVFVDEDDASRSAACSLEGYADEAQMARAAAEAADSDGGASATAVAFEVRAEDGVVAGYEIRARADQGTKALEMQERLGDVFASLAGTGDVTAVSADVTTTAPTAMAFRRFPLPPVYQTSTYAFVAKFLPLAVAATWTYTLLVCAGNVAYERETGLEASMRAFGLPLWTHWAGHGVACALLLGAAALFCGATVTSFGAALFATNQSGSFVFLLLSLTVCAAVSSCFVVATLATDASVAAAGAAVAWLVSYLPYAYVSRPDARIESAFLKALLCFAPSSAQGLGFAAMAQWEAEGVGSSWGNLWRTPPANSAGDIGVPLGATLLILALDCVGFAALALAIDAARFKARRGGADGPKEVADDPADLLANDATSSGGIVADTLRVVYPGADGAPEKVALRGLSLVCPKDEITVLLGHNGAGKSSAISRLVGSAPPTSGRATVGGHDAVSRGARRELGFCPQHDALWDDLTVQDHLDFALRLRGFWGAKALEAERNALLRDVELRAKKRTRAGALSGGMRRRLSVALAFAGDPTHVVLDEPTAGVDPHARRQIQALLLKKAKGKAVLITTHHLDEAERLGTRVAVLHKGELACAGSAEALKARYDVGYRLVVTLRQPHLTIAANEKEKESVAASLLSSFEKAIPSSPVDTKGGARARVTRDGAEAAGEISFAWPMSLSAYLPGALRALDREKQALGVAGYGLAAPSLDGVFKAVQKENDTRYGISREEEARRSSEENLAWFPTDDDASRLSGNLGDAADDADDADDTDDRARFSAVAVAVFVASLRALRRDHARLIATFIAPTLLLLAACAMARFRPTPSTYAASFHVPVVAAGATTVQPRSFLADCDVAPFGAAASSAFAAAFADRAAFETSAVEPRNESGSTLYAEDTSSNDVRCFPEEALWRTFATEFPSALRPRGARDFVGVAAGAGGEARAATIWWSSERVRRGAAAAVARTRALERYTSAFGGGGGTASEIAVASAAAEAADALGAFRPWPKTNRQTRRAILSSTPGPAAAAAAALLAVSVPPCLAAAAAAKQRASGLRRVLLVAGAPKLAHWLGTVSADVAALVPATAIHVLAACAAGGDALLGAGWARLPDAFALFYAHAFAALAVAHVVSLVVGEEGAHRAFPACLLAGALPATALAGMTYALDATGDVAGADAAFSVARFFPGFAVAQGTLELALASALSHETLAVVERGKVFEFERTADGANGTERLMASYSPIGGGVRGLIDASLVAGLVAAALLVLLDGAAVAARALLEQCVSSEVDVRRAIEAEGERDADVVAEETRLKELSGFVGKRSGPERKTDLETGDDSRYDDALRVFGLRKAYLGGASSRPAVRDLWLGVKAGETFGLLGINGSGKTTTFRMAAGDLPPTAGRVEIGKPPTSRETKTSKNAKNAKNAKAAVGYCPQKDALVRSLTVLEHMRLVAAARGLRSAAAETSARSAARAAGLGAFAATRAGALSGGNRRKLCLAMALLGLRREGLALLDEPTAGVDPSAREVISGAIRDAAKRRQCACVVTSHAVEDVAALCDRVGVMVDGAMRCLGAPQHLRSAHGEHLTLTVHVRRHPDNVNRLESREEDSSEDSLDAFVRAVAPGASAIGGAADASGLSSASVARAARAFGFIEGASKEDDDALAEATRVAVSGVASAEAAAGVETATSRTWELPASADLPSVLEALEKKRATREIGNRSAIEGYAVGQASLEDVFLEFASRGSAQSDAQMMAMEDALFAHRLELSKKDAAA